jgi:hypothetical protein
LENVPPLAGSQWLRPRTGALRLGLGQHATGGNFGVRVKSLLCIHYFRKGTRNPGIYDAQLPCFYKEKISQSCPLFWYAACGQHLAQVPFGARYHAVNRVGACFHSGRGKGFQGVAVPSRLHNLLAKSIAGFSIQAYETLETNKVAGTANPNAITACGQPSQRPLIMFVALNTTGWSR